MNHRSDIERQRDRYARASEREAAGRYAAMSGTLWLVIGTLIDTLTTDRRGRIRFTVRNINTANRVGIAVQSFNNNSGTSFFRWLLRRFTRLLGLNLDYFAAMPEIEPETVEDRVRRLLLRRYGYNPETGALDPAGYLAANLRQNGQSAAVAQRINQAIAARMNLREFKRQFRRDFARAGSPLSVGYHYNRFARDIFQEFDRTTQLVYADELGMEHAIYSGTVKNNTRCFCEKRVNRIYENEFIAAWNNQEWQGKKDGVDVRIALGGHNCRHILSWITEGTATQIAARRKQKVNTYNKVLC